MRAAAVIRQVIVLFSGAVLLAGLGACTSSGGQQAPGGTGFHPPAADPASVPSVDLGQAELAPVVASMMEVLGNPEKFVGKRVRLIGVADFQFGIRSGSYLYFSSEHRFNWTNDAIRLVGLEEAFPNDLELLPQINAQWVVVEGVFHYNPPPEGDSEGRDSRLAACVLSCNGELHDVNRISLWGMAMP
ncbi:MAG: hypothetical protein R3217_07150 [Gammaproteobacteria bacterium]|nr:hypothetical protein [Gammaproteobacteria bacterium]